MREGINFSNQLMRACYQQPAAAGMPNACG
jgi:hypothetical protein